MKLILNLIFILTAIFVDAQNVTLNNFYRDNNKTAVVLCLIQPGEYVLRLNVTNPNDRAVIDLGVECADKAIDFTSVIRQYDIKGKEELKLNFTITEEATYKILIHFIEGRTLGAIPYIEVINGKVTPLALKQAPQIQLEYVRDNNQPTEYEWVYGEVAVPKGYDPAFTSIIPLGYKEGMLGVAVGADHSGRIVFIVSEDRHNQENALEGRGASMRINIQQDKMHQHIAYYPFEWGMDTIIRFLMNRKELDENKVLISAWFNRQYQDEWKYIASWKVDKAQNTENYIYSYLKNTHSKTGIAVRKAEIFRVFGKEANGEWDEMNKARFTVVKSYDREDYEAGITDDDPQGFYLLSGGFERTVQPAQWITISKTELLPEVDLADMETSLKNELESSSQSWNNARFANLTAIPDIFTDKTCLALKPNIGLPEIEKIEINVFKDLALALYHHNYPLSYRIGEYAPYPKPSTAALQNKTNSYSLLDNPTGIFVEQYENIVVFTENLYGQKIKIRSVNLDKDYACVDYLLQEGMNVFKAQDKGLLYVMHHSNDPNAKSVKIHIASGRMNGYYDVGKNTGNEWKSMLESTVCEYFDVLGKYAHLTFAVEDFKRYTPDIEELIHVYDSIVWLEQQFIGFGKYNRMNKNRMYFHLSPLKHSMFATENRTGYNQSVMYKICDPEQLRTRAIWGPAHEVGHINQTKGFKWVGLTEVSNNIYSMYVQQQFGNPSRLATEGSLSDNGKVWNNCYEKGFTEMIANKVSQMQHGDVFCKLIPFWQLQLYNAEVNGYTDFYADVHEQIRNNPVPRTDSDAQLQFMKICCDIAKTDFTDFFEKWGMLIVTSDHVKDLSSIPGMVNYHKYFKITPKQVDKLKKYAKKYKKPEDNMQYIHDEAIVLFKDKPAIKEGKIEKVNNQIKMIGWENVLVYEVYEGNKLLFVSPAATFTIPERITTPVIHAVPAKGDPIVKKL